MPATPEMREAFDNGKRVLDMLKVHEARCMEQVIDREHALFFERWLLPNGVGVVAIYSPTYRNLYIEAGHLQTVGQS